MPYHAMPCHAIPCHAMPCHAIPYHTIHTDRQTNIHTYITLRYVTLHYITLQYITLHYIHILACKCMLRFFIHQTISPTPEVVFLQLILLCPIVSILPLNLSIYISLSLSICLSAHTSIYSIFSIIATNLASGGVSILVIHCNPAFDGSYEQ